MKRTRRKFGSKVLTNLDLEALKELSTFQDLASEFEIHPNQITMDGKGRALDNAGIERF